MREMDVARVHHTDLASVPPDLVVWFVPRRPAAATQSRGGGDTRSATYPVDDIHQARNAYGVGGWGITFGEDKRGIGELIYFT